MTQEDLAALSAQAPAIRERLGRFRESLARHFVERHAVVDLMTIAAVAGEPLLLVGPPGTAKSELVLKLREALAVPDEDAFEYMLTRFTEPAEVFGPLDLAELKDGRYVRRIRGKLPSARVAFLDEIFQASSAILNSLLTVLQERRFFQDGQAVPVRLDLLYAATNELPEHDELLALRDRFPLKVLTEPVHDRHFSALVDAGLAGLGHRELGRRPWAEGHASLEDVVRARRYLTWQMSSGADDRAKFFPETLFDELRRLLRTLEREEGIPLSDRRVVRLYRLIRARAWLLHGGAVEREDLTLCAHLGESKEQLARLAERVPALLGL
jgi:MoxR-like ATPase